MGFLHSTLLAYGLPAVSIPIIIHLLNRRRFRKMRWAAMEFLLKAKKQNKRKIQLENWLLLLLRALLVFLILLMIARPIVTGGLLTVVPGIGESVERIIVLDDSSSLTDKIGGQSSYDRAKSALSDLCKSLTQRRSGDKITIIRGSRPTTPDATRFAPGSNKLVTALNVIAKSDATDLPIDLPAITKYIANDTGTRGDQKRVRRVLYFLTDLRKSDWVGPNGAAATQIATNLREFQRAQDNPIPVLVVDVSTQQQENVAIDEFITLDRVIATNVPVRFSAVVHNYGTAPVNNAQLILKVGESAAPIATVSNLDPGESKRLQLRYTFREPGNSALTLELAGVAQDRNRLTRDDRRHLALNVLETIRVLVVDGEPATQNNDSEVFSLLTGLAPTGDAISGVTTRKIIYDDILDEDLSQYEVIILANVEIWPSERLAALENFVKRGGGLAIFVGDQIDTARYMRDFWKAGKGLLPAPLGEKLGSGSDDKATRMSVTDVQHPILKNFQGIEDQLIGRVAVWNYLSVPMNEEYLSLTDKKAKHSPRVIATYKDEAKTPAIIEKTFGTGHVLLFNSSADSEWGNWPRQIAFVPILQESLRFLAPSASSTRNLSAGEQIDLDLSLARFENRVLFQGPQSKSGPIPIFAQPQPNSARQRVKITETSRTGIYQMTLTPRPGASEAEEITEYFAVNLVNRESDLKQLTSVELAKNLPEVKIRTTSLADSRSLLDLSEGQRKETWRTILFLFLLLLVAEGALALRAGHHSSAVDRDDLARLNDLRN